jgi:hypothetical protein
LDDLTFDHAYSDSDAGSVPPPKLRLGSEAHKALFCASLLETHDPYRPRVIDWPKLDPETRSKVVSLPIWDIAVRTEGRASLNVRTYAQAVKDPLLKAAMEMDGFEEGRHKLVLANMVQAYDVEMDPEPNYKTPRDPEWAFMVTGYAECIDSFFGFGLFDIARRTGFFPADLTDTFEPIMREEARHILFFVNWVAWWRRNMPIWRRPWFELKVLAVWAFLIRERLGLARDMEKNPKGQDHNFTLSGSKELGVEITFAELANACLAENDRRLGLYSAALVRPVFVPNMVRLALRLLGSRQPRAAGSPA